MEAHEIQKMYLGFSLLLLTLAISIYKHVVSQRNKNERLRLLDAAVANGREKEAKSLFYQLCGFSMTYADISRLVKKNGAAGLGLHLRPFPFFCLFEGRRVVYPKRSTRPFRWFAATCLNPLFFLLTGSILLFAGLDKLIHGSGIVPYLGAAGLVSGAVLLSYFLKDLFFLFQHKSEV